MPAPKVRFDDALEIAVCDLPVPDDEVEHEGTLSLLPCSRGLTDVHAVLEADEEDVEEDVNDELADDSGEWLAEDDVVLEPSDVLEVEAARSAVLEFSDVDVDVDIQDLLDEQLDDEVEETLAVEIDVVEIDEVEIDVVETDEVESFAVELAAETLVDAAVADEHDEHDNETTTEAVDEDEDEDEADEQVAASERALVDPIRVPLWSGLNSFAYALSRGLRGMAQAPLVQLVAVGTMAVCMLLLGTTTLILQNAQRVAHDLGIDTPVTVYMQPDVDADTLAQLQARVTELPEVASVEHVTPEMALARLQDGLGEGDSIASVGDNERAELLAGIDASNLPDSLEIGLVAGVEPGFADALAGRIGAMQGVEEVSALGPWVQDVDRMLTTLRWLAFGVAALVSLACLAIVWNTIRLGVFARRSEIEILRLVGGTGRFVRGPFVVEGVVQGVLGTALAIACLWLGFELIRPFLERGMALMFAAGSLRFFSMIELCIALGFGAVLGLIGSRAAVARHA